MFNKGLRRTELLQKNTAATHTLHNLSHKHLKYLSTANELQKELQVSHPLLGKQTQESQKGQERENFHTVHNAEE